MSEHIPAPEQSGESILPSQAIVPHKGRPRENFTVQVETKPDEPLSFLGSDGHYHRESPKAARAFQDYLNLGPNRSFQKLAEHYLEINDPEWASCKVETIRRVIARYSSNLDWQNRLRLHLAHESAAAVASARKSAARHKHERIRRSNKLMEIGEAILDRAELLDASTLSPAEARQLVKPAITMIQVGLSAEKAEIGESIERIQPPKPIETMTEEELDEYINVLRTEL
jgi:hypothetical protein